MANTTDNDKSGDEIKNPQDYLDENGKNVLVDLTEVYEKVGGKDIDILVDGIEHFNVGKLPDRVNRLLKVSFEPGTTAYNARCGSESFIATIKDGFLKFIKAIITYIQEACKWIANGIRFILGFEKTERQQAEYKKLRTGLKEELIAVLSQMGLPPGLYDIGKLMESVPEASSRIETLQFIHNKLQSDEEGIERLTRTIPSLNKLTEECSTTIREVNYARSRLRGQIDKLRGSIRRGEVSELQAKELEVSIAECRKRLDLVKISNELNKVIETTYGITPQMENGEINFEQLSKQLKDGLEVVKSKVDPSRVASLQDKIGKLEAEIMRDDNLGLIRGLDKSISDLFKTLHYSDAETINQLATLLNDKTIERAYLVLNCEVKTFSNDINEVVKIIKNVKMNTESLIKWRNKAEALLQTYLTQDLDTIRKHLAQLRANGELDPSLIARDGTPMKYILNDAINPETYIEKITQFNKQMIDSDVLDIKKKVAAFRSQLGL